MRYLALMALPLAALTKPLVAQQDFEGTVVLKVNGVQGSTMTWKVKAERSMATLGQAIEGRAETRYIVDRDQKTSTILVPLPGGLPFAQGVEGLRITTPLDTADAANENDSTAITLKKLGTSQTIAGIKCDDYEASDSSATHLCLTSALGNFFIPSSRNSLGSLLSGLGGGIGGGMAGGMPLRAFGGNGTTPQVMTFGNPSGGNGGMMVMGDGNSGAVIVGTNTATTGAAGAGTVVGGNATTIVMNGTAPAAGAGGAVSAGPVFMGRSASSDGTRQVITMTPQGGTVTTIDANGKSTTVPLSTDQLSALPRLPAPGAFAATEDAPTTVRTIPDTRPSWARALGNKGFPLKVWIPGGKVLLETTSVTRGPIGDENFIVPSGYVDQSELGAMLRNMGGGGL